MESKYLWILIYQYRIACAGSETGRAFGGDAKECAIIVVGCCHPLFEKQIAIVKIPQTGPWDVADAGLARIALRYSQRNALNSIAIERRC